MFIYEILSIIIFGMLSTAYLLTKDTIEEFCHSEFFLYATYKDRLVYSHIILNGITKEEYLDSNPTCTFFYKRENTLCITSQIRSGKIDLLSEKTARRIYPGDFDNEKVYGYRFV